MPNTEELTLCKWCDEPLVRHRKRKYHETPCQKLANVHRQNVLRRIKDLGRRCGALTTVGAEKLVQQGCAACGKQSHSWHGPKKSNPYPSYRVWSDGRDGWLLCPQCHHQLWVPLMRASDHIQAFWRRVQARKASLESETSPAPMA